jgi:group I intron endonuclease
MGRRGWRGSLNFIYVLKDPRTLLIRYVGVTNKTLGSRLSRHMWAANHGMQTHVSRWIRLLGARPIIEEVERNCSRSREKFWIKHFKSLGCELTNITDGGEGLSGYTPTVEHRQKISRGNLGKTQSSEARQRISTASKGRSKPPFSKTHKKHISKAQKGKKRGPHSTEHIRNIGLALKGNTNGRGNRGKKRPDIYERIRQAVNKSLEQGGDRVLAPHESTSIL